MEVIFLSCPDKVYIFVPVKFLASILSIYLLLLSVVPCSDKPEGAAGAYPVVSVLTDHHAHHGEDACTPLCSCSCCRVNMSQSAAVRLLLIPEGKTHYPERPVPAIEGRPAFYWQPPQV